MCSSVESFSPTPQGWLRASPALHAAGTTHGRLDAGAIQFSAAHPAKLTAFGRTDGPFDDTAALAASLRLGVTGNLDPTLPPSQVVAGLSASVDAVLDDAQTGRIDAAQLATALRSIPSHPGLEPFAAVGHGDGCRW